MVRLLLHFCYAIKVSFFLYFFKTGGVDGCNCEETLKLISEGKINTESLITHTYPLKRIEEAYELFENKRDGVIKVAVEC